MGEILMFELQQLARLGLRGLLCPPFTARVVYLDGKLYVPEFFAQSSALCAVRDFLETAADNYGFGITTRTARRDEAGAFVARVWSETAEGQVTYWGEASGVSRAAALASALRQGIVNRAKAISDA